MDFSNNGSRSSDNENKRILNPTNTQNDGGAGLETHEPVQQGEALFNRIVQSTGLPSEWVSSELKTILDDAGQDRSSMTLEDLRAVMLAYLESTLGAMEGVSEEEADQIEEAFNAPGNSSGRLPVDQ